MYLLTKWEGRTGKYLALGLGPYAMTEGKYFPVWPDLNSFNEYFIMWGPYIIHEHLEYEV